MSGSRIRVNGHGSHREEPDGDPLRPLLRWVGGKQQIVTKLVHYLPKDIFDRRYLEPFAGAASLFFRIAPSRAVLSDANPHLIACYECIRDNPLAVARELSCHARDSSEAHYYGVRRAYNRRSNGIGLLRRLLALSTSTEPASAEYFVSIAMANSMCEPPRVHRSLHSLKGWSYGQQEQVLTRGQGTGGSDGVRARTRARLAVVGHAVGRFEARVLGGDAAQLGAPVRA
ncbi:MAG: DNA adenine methylase [bacterium]